MTATQVNGIEVITAEPVLSPLSKPDKPVPFKNILQLLLADGSTIYGCGMDGCDYTDEKTGRIRLHFRSHNGQKPQVRSVPKFADSKVKEKGKPAKTEPQPEPEDNGNPIEFLAALERMFNAPEVNPDEVAALKARITELETELATTKETLAETANERDFWKQENAVGVGTVQAITEIIKRSKIK